MVHIAMADWTQGHCQVLHRHDFSEIFILLEGIGKYTIGGRLYDMLPVPVTVWIACGVSVLGVAACYIGLSKASAQRPELES